MRPQVGQVVNNKYRLLRLIGDGGMGSVYEARHEVLGTSVALKFLHEELGKRPGLVQRFLQEARVSAQIQSPHVVRVTDVDQGVVSTGSPGGAPNGAFIVMEYIEGKTLQSQYEELYKAGLSLSYPDALEYAMQMLEGVEAAHRSGIVHRDLKPDNVMITVDAKGRTLIKLLDFGIAKLRVAEVEGPNKALTRPGVIMGTPEYMAPEQAFSADAVDARADIFSLGVIVFEMLAGRRPVGGEDPHQIAGAYLSGHISHLTDLAPDIAPDLADAVHRAMSPAAGDRWPTVAAFRDAMEPFALAAKAPSVMPSQSLSRISLTSGIIPAPSLGPSQVLIPAALVETTASTAMAADPAGQRSVPKTLPPADTDETPPIANGGSTSPGDPPAMSNPPERGPTPLGGFGRFDHEAPAGEAAIEASPQFIPATRSAVPISSRRVDPAATALVTPLPSLSPQPAAVMSPAEAMPFLPPVVPAPSARAQKPKRRGALSSLPAILLLATGVSGAVVGGVYLAHSRAKADDHEDPPIATVPTTTVAADPPPATDSPDPTAPPPTGPTAPVAHPWKPTSQSGKPPFTSPPKGSTGPGTPKPPSTDPVIVIPTSLPIPTGLLDFPFGPRPAEPPRGDPPRGRPAPQQQPPQAPPPPPR